MKYTLIVLIILGFSIQENLAFGRSQMFEISKSTLLIPDANKTIQENIEEAGKYENERLRKKINYSCQIVYEGQAIKILSESSVDSIKVKVKEGSCKGKIGYLHASSIRVRKN